MSRQDFEQFETDTESNKEPPIRSKKNNQWLRVLVAVLLVACCSYMAWRIFRGVAADKRRASDQRLQFQDDLALADPLVNLSVNVVKSLLIDFKSSPADWNMTSIQAAPSLPKVRADIAQAI